uniref:RHS repeat-associated core domain-containing protein n=1 Tax=uncultured Psychrobacter sp. TaxID=259303 RepID=UPI00259AD422
IRFQGQHFDEETGLSYNRFRYYDPDMGMFTTRDPIGLMGGDNVFQYAPNPTGWVDPLGLRGGLSRGSISKAEGMNQARVMNGDGPLCNILGIGCNDDHFKCTSATYPKKMVLKLL